MNTLTIAHLFLNLQSYKDQYLTILENPEQYFVPIADAYINIWPVGKEQLYLGDLLQLWLGEKWIVNTKKAPLINTILRDQTKAVPEFDRYVFSLQGNLLTSQNSAQAWSIDASESEALSIESLFHYYCVFKSLSRPQTSASFLNATLKKAI